MDPYIRDFKHTPIETHTINNNEEYKIVTGNSNESFKIFHNNIRSMSKNIDELEVFLSQFEHEFDVVILTETWRIHDLSVYKKPSYDILYNQGNINQNDGVLVYIKNNLVYHHDVIKFGEINIINLKISVNNKTINILALYRPHPTNPYLFNEELKTFLNNNKGKSQDISLLIGDININIHRHLDYVEEYLNILSEEGYVSYINKTTREEGNSTSCIDHIFIRSKGNSESFIPLIYHQKITDHFPIILHIDSGISKKHTVNPINYKIFINYKKLKQTLSSENWNEIYSDENVDLATVKFINKLKSYIDSCKRSVRIKNSEVKRSPWITKGIMKSIETKNNLYTKHKKNPENGVLENEYKKYRNKLNLIIKNTKMDYYKSQINKNKNSSKNLWHCVKNICNQKTKQNNINKIELKNGDLTSDTVEIANAFIDHYSTVGKNLASQIEKPETPPNTIKNNINSIYMSNTNTVEIKESITELKTGKAPGNDEITAEILKEIKEIIAEPLTYIFNLSISNGIWPKSLKVGIIKPLYKGGDKTQVINYRPISLISSIAKVYEKIIKRRIDSFLKKYNILSKMQFGFQNNISTEDAISYLTNNIYQSLDNNNEQILCLFIDLAKAFDTVSHQLLLKKLTNIGFRGNAYNLIESYLTSREQYVKIDKTDSYPKTVEYGVPQGTVLGPVLFNLYINDLFELPSKGEILSFADDTVIIYKDKNWKTVKSRAENDFKHIKQWFDYNMLTINYQKSTYLPFTSYKNNLPNLGPLNINSDENNIILINEAECVKYLGIIIDRHLRWDLQVNSIIRKLRPLLFKFKYLKQFLDLPQLNILYYSLVQSQLTYGIIGWGGVNNNYLKHLEIMQKWFLKIIYSKNITYPTNDLFNLSKKMDIKQLFSQKILINLFKNDHIIKYKNHTYSTRNKQTIKTKVNKTIGQRNYIYIGPKIYDLLPVELKNITSLKKYKKEIKSWIQNTPRLLLHQTIDSKNQYQY